MTDLTPVTPPPAPEPPPQDRIPRSPAETRRLLRVMKQDVERLVAQRDAEMADQMALEGGVQELRAQQALMEQQKRQEEQMALLEQDLLRADYRQPDVVKSMELRIRSLAGAGQDPSRILPDAQSPMVQRAKEMLDTLHERAEAVQAYQEDLADLRRYIGAAFEEPGFLERAGRAVGGGLVSGLTLSESPDPVRSAIESLRTPLAMILAQRGVAQEQLPEGSERGMFFSGTGWKPRAKLRNVDPEVYAQLLQRGYERELRKALQERGQDLSEKGWETFLRKVAEYGSMAAPFKAATTMGGAAVRGLAGAGKKALGKAVGKTLLEAGAATGKLGKLAQDIGGGMGVLFAYGAAQPLEGSRKDLAAAAKAKGEDVEGVMRLENGLSLALSLPVFHLAGALGGRLGAGIKNPIGKAAAHGLGMGATFTAVGEGFQKAVTELGPATSKLIELEVLANEDLRGPIENMLRSAAAKDWKGVVENAKHYASEVLPAATAFGAMNLLHTLRTPIPREQVLNLYRRARDEAEKFVEGEREKRAMLERLDEMLQSFPVEERGTKRLRGQAEKVVSEAQEEPSVPFKPRDLEHALEIERVLDRAGIEADVTESPREILDRVQAEAERIETEKGPGPETDRAALRAEALRGALEGEKEATQRALTRLQALEGSLPDAPEPVRRIRESMELVEKEPRLLENVVSRYARPKAYWTMAPKDVEELRKTLEALPPGDELPVRVDLQLEDPETGFKIPYRVRFSPTDLEALLEGYDPKTRTFRIGEDLYHASPFVREILEAGKLKKVGKEVLGKVGEDPTEGVSTTRDETAAVQLLEDLRLTARVAHAKTPEERLEILRQDDPEFAKSENFKNEVEPAAKYYTHLYIRLMDRYFKAREKFWWEEHRESVPDPVMLGEPSREMLERPPEEFGVVRVLPQRTKGFAFQPYDLLSETRLTSEAHVVPQPDYSKVAAADYDLGRFKAGERPDPSRLSERVRDLTAKGVPIEEAVLEELHESLAKELHEPPGRFIPTLKQVGKELAVLEQVAARYPRAALNWVTQRAPLLRSPAWTEPLRVGAEHVEWIGELRNRIEAVKDRVLLQSNEAGSIYIPSLHEPLQKVRELLRGSMNRRVSRWTQQLERTLDDPDIRSRSGLKDWKEALTLRGATQLVTRYLLPWFETPLNKWGGFAAEAGMTRGMLDAHLKVLQTGVERLLRRAGVVEEDPVERFNPEIRDHLLRELIEKGEDSQYWKDAPEELQDAALQIREMLDTFRDAAAKSSKAYLMMEQLRDMSRKASQSLLEEVKRLETAEMDRVLSQLPEEARHAWDMLLEAESKLKAAKKAKEAPERIAALKAEVQEWRDSVHELTTGAGWANPIRLRALIRATTRKAGWWRKRAEKYSKRMEQFVESWGFREGYVHDMPIMPILSEGSATKGREEHGFPWPMEPVSSVTTGAVRRRTGALRKSEILDYSGTRSVLAYLRKIVPYIHLQQFLNRWSPAIFGEWKPADRLDMEGGINSLKRGQKYYSAEIIAPIPLKPEKVEVEGKEAKKHRWGESAQWDAVLGLHVRTEDGGWKFVRRAEKPDVAGKTKAILLWRSSRRMEGLPRSAQLADPDWVARQVEAGNLAVVDPKIADRVIRVRTGGFLRDAHPARRQDLMSYVRDLTRVTREAHGRWALFASENPRAITDAIDKLFRTIAYWSSVRVLGFLNPFTAMNAATGAMFVNSLIIGATRSVKALSHSMEFARRSASARLTGDLYEDLRLREVAEPDAVGRFRLEAARKLRTGKDELFDDFAEWLYQSGLLSGTRGHSYFTRTEVWDPGDYATKPNTKGEALGKAVRTGLDSTYAMFDSMEFLVRTALAGEVYMQARKAGLSKAEAEKRAAKAVILAHGVFNPALRSRFFKSGLGMMLGSVQGWVSQFTGTLLRLPPREKVEVLAKTLVAIQLAAMLDLDWDTEGWQGLDIRRTIGMRLSDVPIVGKTADFYTKKWIDEFFGEGVLFPAGLGIPTFVVQPDSPVVQVFEDLQWAIDSWLKEEPDRAEEAMAKAVQDALVPATVEHIRRAFDTEPVHPDKPEGKRIFKELYKVVLGRGKGTPVWDYGMAQIWKDFLPGTLMEVAKEHSERERARYADEMTRGRRRTMKLRLSRILREMMEGKDTREKLKSWFVEARKLGIHPDPAYWMDARNRAQAEKLGLTRFASIIWHAPSKAEKVRRMAEWLEDRTAHVEPEDIFNAENILGGRRGFGEWLMDPKIPPVLIRRYLDARMRRTQRTTSRKTESRR